MQSHQKLESDVLKEAQNCRRSIEQVMESINNLSIDDFLDNIIQSEQQILESKNHQEEQKIIEGLQYDCKKPFEHMDNILGLLGVLTPQYTDSKYIQELIGEKAKKKGIISSQIMWDQVRISQKEKFSRYNDEQLKEEIFELDKLLDEKYEYTLSYTADGKRKTIQVKYVDVLKLNPPNYLNDSIINFYLKFLENELINQELREKTYIFNTYFMEKLCPQDKVTNIDKSEINRLTDLFNHCFEQIKKWVKEDLFAKDYLLFPLNLPEHWSLIVIKLIYKKIIIQIVYKPGNVFKKQPCYIIYMDSFGIIDQKIILMIKLYLHKMWCQNSQEQSQFADSPIKNIQAFQPLVPRQVNYVDCGVFLLEYAEAFLNNTTYVVDKIEEYTSIDKLRLFPRCLVNKKRFLLKQLLINLIRLSKEEAIQIYKQEREKILIDNSILSQYQFLFFLENNQEEYDQIDQEYFQQYLAMKLPTERTQEQMRSILLDFYMNPNLNYYHTEMNQQ